MSRAGLDKDPHDVATMFDAVAEHYDRTNSVASLGFDRHWRAMTRRVLDLRPDERVLDVAAGTAVSTVELARSGAWCVAADFSLGMLRHGADRDVPKVGADAMRLPFADGVFDAVTISFGLRNIVDPVAALAELRRVTRPGGRLVVCEFATPVWAPVRWAYQRIALKALPVITRRVASNPEAYRYLAESILGWPDQTGLATRIERSGWRRVEWLDLTGGIVALHRAINAEMEPS
ncbi:MAG TPA: demethylmenaquinone methyltransferase [Pseudonocardiaceae bacterium]|jgi:demethylmenaquinone methyltransferase/2-methoxy-6-polyprenyl-1,4-benzoquinol methylase|nr:demethylmenaquinone methyltransferase [Pseudonocardiaceae bacterium]